MKKLLFAAFALASLFAVACSNRDNQVLVRFQNATDSEIKDARMDFSGTNVTDLGLIPAGGETDYIAFDYFEVGYYPGGDYQYPTGNLKGEKDGEPISGWSGNWCGTGVEYKQLEPGKYTIEITPSGDDSPWAYLIKFVD